MPKILYIVEGTIEKRFFQSLQRQKLIKPGKISIFNMMQAKLEATNNILTMKRSRVVAALDTDCFEDNNLDKLIHNSKMLKQICGNVCFLIQNKNFEDELKQIFSTSDLCGYFGLKHKTQKDLKHYLAQSVIYDNMSWDRLDYYCARTDKFVSVVTAKGYTYLAEKVIGIRQCR